MTATVDHPPAATHPQASPLMRFVINNRAALGTLAVFVVMMIIFLIANLGQPSVLYFGSRQII